MTAPRAARLTPTLTLIVTLLLAASACGGHMFDRDQRLAELRARPDQATAAAEMRAVVDQLRTRLETELGIGGWAPFGGPLTRAGCIGHSDIPRAEEITVARLGRSGPIPDAQWPRVLQILIEVTAPHGFSNPSSPAAKPGLYDVTVKNQYGGYINLATSKNTTIGARTGCHLRTERNNP